MNSKLKKSLYGIAAALATAAVAATTASAAASSIQLGPDRITVNPKTYGFKVDVSCPAGGQPCAGVLDIETASAIKPYSKLAAKKWDVGTFPFTIPAGATRAATGRVLGAALAQLSLSGSVKLHVSARISATGQTAGSRVLTFVMKSG